MAGNKKTEKENYVKHHKDGSVWAKGTAVGGAPEGYWEWFRKDGTQLRSGYFAGESKPANGPPTIKTATSTK